MNVKLNLVYYDDPFMGILNHEKRLKVSFQKQLKKLDALFIGLKIKLQVDSVILYSFR